MDNNDVKKANDIIANIIMYILKYDNISMLDVSRRFKLGIEAMESVTKSMIAAGIIGQSNGNGECPVLINSIKDLQFGIIEFLNENNFTNDQIEKALVTLKKEDKEEVSLILKEDRDWSDINNKPDINIPVVMRIVNKNMIYVENRNEILYAEDIKIGQFDGNNWHVYPPYPKYDYSPLSQYSELNDGSIVSHWAPVESGELEAWNNRFKRIFDYPLKIEVDPEHEETVYKALMWGAAYISKFGGPDFYNEENNLHKMYEVLCDMQAYIDLSKNCNEDNISIVDIVDKILTKAVDSSSNGLYDFTWEDIKEFIPNKELYNKKIIEILSELYDRDEVISTYVEISSDGDYIIYSSLDLKYCINYEWQEGDEKIFECSKEEWENRPFAEIKLRGGK